MWLSYKYQKKLKKLLIFVKKYIFRGSHQRCSIETGVLRNFVKFTGKHLCQSVFFNKAQAWGLNFTKFPRTLFLQNTSRRLLIYVVIYSNSVNLLLSVSSINVYTYCDLVTLQNFWSRFWINQDMKLLFLIS